MGFRRKYKTTVSKSSKYTIVLTVLTAVQHKLYLSKWTVQNTFVSDAEKQSSYG